MDSAEGGRGPAAALAAIQAACAGDAVLYQLCAASLRPYAEGLGSARWVKVQAELTSGTFWTAVHAKRADPHWTRLVGAVFGFAAWDCARPPPPPPSWPEAKQASAWEPFGLSWAAYGRDLAAQFGPEPPPAWPGAEAAAALVSSGGTAAALSAALAALSELAAAGDPATALVLAAVRLLVSRRGAAAPAVGAALVQLRRAGLAPGDIAALWYDFAIDNRLSGELLSALVNAQSAIVQLFAAKRPELVPKLYRLCRDFLRVAGAGAADRLKTIFELFRDYWYLDLEPWALEGAHLIRKHGLNHAAVADFFARKSGPSRRLWESIDSAITFDGARPWTEPFVQGLAERPVELRRDPEGNYSTDGQRIYLPAVVAESRDKEVNRLRWRHGCAHEAAHILFGTFAADPAARAAVAAEYEARFPGLLARRRADLAELRAKLQREAERRGWRLDLAAVFEAEGDAADGNAVGLLARLPFVRLAKLVQNVYEDLRIEAELYGRFAGLARERERDHELACAGWGAEWKSQEAPDRLAEAWVRHALGIPGPSPAGQAWEDAFRRMAAEADGFLSGRPAGVYDAWRATGRTLAIYSDWLRRSDPAEWERRAEFPAEWLFMTLFIGSDGVRPAGSPLETLVAAGRIDYLPEAAALAQAAAAAGDGPGDAGAGGARLRRSRRSGRETAGGPAKPGDFAAEAERMAKHCLTRPWLDRPPAAAATYPEWSAERSDYLEDHAVVYDFPPDALAGSRPAGLAAAWSGRIGLVRRAFERIRPKERDILRGQDDGDEADFDEWFDALCEWKAGAQMDGDVYRQTRRNRRDVACLVLLDASASTSQPADGQPDRSIFWCQQSAAYLMAEAMAAVGDASCLLAAFDFGAHLVLNFPLKRWDEAWSYVALDRLDRAAPPDEGYSRMAPSLRHATEQLRRRDAAVRLLFFITDGLPFYLEGAEDRGEVSDKVTRDGVAVTLDQPVPVVRLETKGDAWIRADLRKAAEEARLAGVELLCVNLHPPGQKFLESVFPDRVLLVPEPGQLPERLLAAFRRMAF